MTNPFAPPPTQTASEELVSGGGADGLIDHVVEIMISRLNFYSISPAADPGYPDARQCDLAEILSWACRAAGVDPVPPSTDARLYIHCRMKGTPLDVDKAMSTKGAMIFAGQSAALSLGSRSRVIIYDQTAGPVVTQSTIRGWSYASTIPGARGYR